MWILIHFLLNGFNLFIFQMYLNLIQNLINFSVESRMLLPRKQHTDQCTDAWENYGPTVPVAALTATASTETWKMIIKELCMTDSTFQLVVDPNKRNIKYRVFETRRGRDDICDDFDWLVSLIRKKGKDIPRMLVFFRKIDSISDVF